MRETKKQPSTPSHDPKEEQARVLRALRFSAQLMDARRPEAEIAALPEDTDWSENSCSPSNEYRAGFAEQALRAYNKETGSDLETCIRDLISDLGHFCDRHKMGEEDSIMDEEIEFGKGNYEYETNGKGTAFTGA